VACHALEVTPHLPRRRPIHREAEGNSRAPAEPAGGHLDLVAPPPALGCAAAAGEAGGGRGGLRMV
jgi:hypothetical protein